MSPSRGNYEEDKVWTTQGFDGFGRGTCGNAGQNLYVSRTGVLQRIHQYDLTRNGWIDLVFCNSQDHCERPPTSVFADVMSTCSKTELPSDGARSGAVADLNGNGYDDLVLANEYGGEALEVNSFVYYGE